MGTSDKVIRCDCGFEARGHDPARLAAAARQHGLDAHGMEFSPDDLLAMAVPAESDRSDKQHPSDD